MKQMQFDWKRMIVGAGAALGTALALCAVGAALVSAGTVAEEWLNYMAAGILVGSSLTGAFLCSGPWEAVLSGGILWLMLAGINAVGFGLELRGAGETLLAVAGGSGAAALISLRKKSTRKRRRKSNIVKLNKNYR